MAVGRADDTLAARMTYRPAVRIRAVADFTLGDVMVHNGAAVIVDQAQAQWLIAAGLCRIDAANGGQPWPKMHTR